jgi:hypothetical protein
MRTVMVGMLLSPNHVALIDECHAEAEAGESTSLSAARQESVSAWVDDYASSMGAALAHYTLFSRRRFSFWS